MIGRRAAVYHRRGRVGLGAHPVERVIGERDRVAVTGFLAEMRSLSSSEAIVFMDMEAMKGSPSGGLVEGAIHPANYRCSLTTQLPKFAHHHA
jgi:hypothetical protein